jgi:hypothetical protein
VTDSMVHCLATHVLEYFNMELQGFFLDLVRNKLLSSCPIFNKKHEKPLDLDPILVVPKLKLEAICYFWTSAIYLETFQIFPRFTHFRPYL